MIDFTTPIKLEPDRLYEAWADGQLVDEGFETFKRGAQMFVDVQEKYRAIVTMPNPNRIKYGIHSPVYVNEKGELAEKGYCVGVHNGLPSSEQLIEVAM